MALTIDPKSKLYQVSSFFALKASAYNNVNYRPAGAPANLTLNADTPNGVLGGMLAKLDYSTPANNVVDICTDANNGQEYPIGFFNLSSEGNAFENAPAIASGKVGVYMGCRGIYSLYVFETHASGSPFAAKTFSSAYAVGKRVFAGPYGLVTDINPSIVNTNNPGVPVGVITKSPTTADLEMGIISLL